MITKNSLEPILSRQQVEKAQEFLEVLDKLYWELNYPEVLTLKDGGDLEISMHNIKSIQDALRYQLEAYYTREIGAYNSSMRIKNHTLKDNKVVVEKDKYQ